MRKSKLGEREGTTGQQSRAMAAENRMREQVNSHDSMLILRDMKLVSIAYGELLLCQSEPRYIPTRSKTQS